MKSKYKMTRWDIPEMKAIKMILKDLCLWKVLVNIPYQEQRQDVNSDK